MIYLKCQLQQKIWEKELVLILKEVKKQFYRCMALDHDKDAWRRLQEKIRNCSLEEKKLITSRLL